MRNFTVIGYYESTWRTFAYHVKASDEWDAFSKAGELLKGDRSHAEDVTNPHDDNGAAIEVMSEAIFIAAAPGHVNVSAPCDSGSTCYAHDYMGESGEVEE